MLSVTKCAVKMRKRRLLFQSAFHVGKLQSSLMDRVLVEYEGQYTVEKDEDVKTTGYYSYWVLLAIFSHVYMILL